MQYDRLVCRKGAVLRDAIRWARIAGPRAAVVLGLLVPAYAGMADTTGPAPAGYTVSMTTAAASARNTNKDAAPLPSAETFFAPVLADIETALRDIADVPGMTRHVLPGGSPHLVIFVEGAPGHPPADHPVLHTLRALAGNHQLAIEYQHTRLDDGALLYGAILFAPFPTLELSWECHPYESVACRDGAWEQPFADLSDVEQVIPSNGSATLVLSEDAARRIDHLSAQHGHRTYRLRGAGIADAADLGAYTWVPGLHTVPGVPARFACTLPGQEAPGREEVTAGFLHDAFEVHAAARERVRRELDLAGDVSWTVSEEPPRYVEPFFAWVRADATDGDRAVPVPWYRDSDATAPDWAHLAPNTGGPVTAPIPRHWTFVHAGTAGSKLVPEAPENPEEEAREEAFCALLRRNLGGEIAIVMAGAVVGVAPVDEARPEALPLTRMPAGAADRVAARWEAANPAGTTRVADAADTPEASTRPTKDPDQFQVRLMAEPQHREHVPVTHYQAPGASEHVKVAVREEVILDSSAIRGARLESRSDSLYLHLDLTPEGQDALDGACFSNLGKQLAIVYDGTLLSAPTIKEWDRVELAFKGQVEDWPALARRLAAYLGETPPAEDSAP